MITGMAKYEDAARGKHGSNLWASTCSIEHTGYNLIGFERSVKTKEGASTPQHILISHRPPDAQVLQIYRIPGDPAVSEFERLTHFNIGAGRSIPQFRSIAGDDWRGTWRGGGAIMVMDSDGNEMFQLWSVIFRIRGCICELRVCFSGGTGKTLWLIK